MIIIVKKVLPHGKVPFSGIRDLVVRDAVMKINENIVALKKQLSQVQDAIMELQKK